MKVLLVENHALLRESLKELINSWNAEAEIDDYSSPDEVDPAQKCDLYELIILKIDSPNINDLKAITRFTNLAPRSSLVCLTDSVDHNVVQQMIHLGSKGVVTSTASSAEFLAVLQLVLAGGVFVPSELIRTQAIFSNNVPETNQSSSSSDMYWISTITTNYGLSERQGEVVKHLCEGRSNKVISNLMGLSINTVKAHLTSIFRILEVHNRTEAVALIGKEITKSTSPTPIISSVPTQIRN